MASRTRDMEEHIEKAPMDSASGEERHLNADEPELTGLQTPLLVGQSDIMDDVRRQIAQVAPTDMTVLIQGETGTGKDVVARLIHEWSGGERSGAFVKICCPALPEHLLESELFGHEEGAFTGALKQKPGRLELAMQGTVFLDEITEMPATTQAKFLEFLEHKKFTRVGGTDTITVDTRLVAATNVPVSRLFEHRRFREDLYFRLNQYSIYVPPLRERVEDIPLLVNYFLAKFAPAFDNEDLSVSSKLMSYLMRYHWPGNVRELESIIRRYALTRDEIEICNFFIGREPRKPSGSANSGTYRENEKRVILEALSTARWNRRRAAEILGISYNTLRRRIAKYGLNATT